MTDHQFTGQKLDATGLLYYQARYYDPAVGQFLSPDMLVPDATNVMDYNRYLMTRGNPLKYSDPTGHCVNSQTTNTSEEIAYDNDACWRLANTIGAMWDSTDYWNNRFGSKEVFFDYVATDATNGTDFFQGQLNIFLNNEGREWLEGMPPLPVREQDFGDYTTIQGSIYIFDFALIMDDHRRFYLNYGNSYSIPGISIVRGDILVNIEVGYRDVDNLAVSWEEKSAIMYEALTGEARSVVGGYPYLQFGYTAGINPPYYRFAEAGAFISSSPISLGFSPLNTTIALSDR